MTFTDKIRDALLTSLKAYLQQGDALSLRALCLKAKVPYTSVCDNMRGRFPFRIDRLEELLIAADYEITADIFIEKKENS